MGKGSKIKRPTAGREVTTLPAALARELERLEASGGWKLLEAGGRAATSRSPDDARGWRALGRALLESGRWSDAARALTRVVELAPDDAAVHRDLGFALYRLGRETEAEARYRHALVCRPRFVRALNDLGALLADQGRLAEAASAFREALEIDPDSPFALHCLGVLLDRVGGHEAMAVAFLERSLALQPENADALVALGNVLFRTGRVEESLPVFRRARTLRPLTTWHARRERPDFSVLFLYAPGTGCTPVDYLVGRAPYDCHFYLVLPGPPEDLDLLHSRADVVINMIADPDYCREILPDACRLAECLDRPTVNHPRLIAATDRESIAGRLSDIALCRIPATVRLSGAALLAAVKGGSLHGFDLPVLVRLAGNHGGDEFEKLAGLPAVAAFVARSPAADYDLSEYAEYRSDDGYYRKYRLICVGGALFPYHLAIHDDWKVHGFRTDMANQAWMRTEEEAFLREPGAVFDREQLAALGQVAAATGLDYCGIDCGIDREGRVVVFEANASMLVHDERNPLFAYKNRYIARIKDAFGALLARLAAGGRGGGEIGVENLPAPP